VENKSQRRRSRWRGTKFKAPDVRIALAGNPNAGKTSLFNALTGETQHVGNYPGVTVEKKMARIELDGKIIELVDLPGTYSLSAYSLEEIVTRDFVLRDKPDVVIDVLDSTNLERNLYLCLQFQELGVPIVGALNMTDEAERQGIHINVDLLSVILGIPFVKTVGTRGTGSQKLLEMAVKIAEGALSSTERHLNYGPELEMQHNELISILETDPVFSRKYNSHWMAIKLLENDPDAEKKIKNKHLETEKVLAAASLARNWIQKHFNEDSETVVAEQRYAYIRGACREAVTIDLRLQQIDYTEVIDRIILHRHWGLAIFFVIMFLIYQLTFTLGNPLSDGIDVLVALFQNFIVTLIPAGILRDFIVEGIIGGVGGVLVFYPIVLLLFMGLSFLEDTGYMARAAFVMDKFMHLFGLHGRSFIPFMVSTGCAVPGVMSARTLINPKDRILTILVAPLMMCGAKVPVIAMLTAAFFPKNSGLVFWAIWLSGWVLALTLARIFRKVFFNNETSPFVMELPPYRLPTLRGIWSHVWEKSWSYIKKAGTFILAASVIIWFLLYFPHESSKNSPIASDFESSQMAHLNFSQQPADSIITIMEEANPDIHPNGNGNQLVHSYGGRLGKFLAPVFQPCGFDWRLVVTLFSGFAAKEVIVSSMGIIYGLDDAEIQGENIRTPKSPLKEKLRSDPLYNQFNMLAFMIFVLIYLPCIGTLAVVKKELGKWKYPLFLAGYTVVVAWIMAASVYQIGKFFI
jgi:ferrous iron transport protein B